MERVKGATRTDQAAHKVYDTPMQYYRAPAYCRRCGSDLKTAYHEERLYSVRCFSCDTVTLVKANNPAVAAQIVGEPLPPAEG